MNNTKQVARDLLGKELVRKIGRRILSGIIIETEAYTGKDDPASHAAIKMTNRNKVMFGHAGMSYVYFTYGMYFMLNVVAKSKKQNAGAVLIRGIHPQNGIKPKKIYQKSRIGISKGVEKKWNFSINVKDHF